jgi:hypothetical protein
MPELFVIDLSDMSYTSVPFATDSEYVGLLVLEDDGYTLPQSETVEALVISDESLLLVGNETANLTVSPLPWNAPMGELIWTSTDESVATVDDKGVVTGISEGYTEIIASCGDIEAYCAVNVVKVQGQLYAYNYYNGTEVYGNRVKCKVVKNKVAPPFKTAEFDILYGKGISKSGEILDLAVMLDIIEKSGAWFAYAGSRIGQGKDKARAFLEANPELLAEIEAKIRAAAADTDMAEKYELEEDLDLRDFDEE